MGGYDPGLAPEAYEDMGVDYIVRGEGEVTFRELLRALGLEDNRKVFERYKAIRQRERACV